jgi:hypothetical protein
MEDKDYFDVKISHQSQDKFVGYKNGKWEDLNLPKGHGLAMSITVADPENDNEDVINMLSDYRAIKTIPNYNFPRYQNYINDLNLQKHIDNSITWENRINKLQHKLDALKFHMKNFDRHQEEIQQKFEEQYINSIVEVEETDYIFTFELESFLFQIQSALDILGQIIALAIKDYSFDSYGKFLSGKLSSNTSNNTILNKNLQQVIDNHAQWYENFNSMRNLVTHWGDLLNFKSTTHKPAIDQQYARIYYPQMPDGKKVTRYMKEIWNSLDNLIVEVGKILKDEYK